MHLSCVFMKQCAASLVTVKSCYQRIWCWFNHTLLKQINKRQSARYCSTIMPNFPYWCWKWITCVYVLWTSFSAASCVMPQEMWIFLLLIRNIKLTSLSGWTAVACGLSWISQLNALKVFQTHDTLLHKFYFENEKSVKTIGPFTKKATNKMF